MKILSPRSPYLNWLAGVLVDDRVARVADRPGDLVLGYATGYDAARIAPFVRSLRAVFDGPVALVVDRRPDVLALLQDHDVDAVHPESAAGWAPHPVMVRFAAFTRLLHQYPNAAHVLITDVRDVVFQDAPFQPAPRALEVFAEFEGHVLGQHDFDMKYLSALVGDRMAALVADRPCLCVGTVMGPRAAMDRFCRTVLMLAAIPRAEIGGAFGADQAACNLAVHLGLVEAEVKPNFGRVATVGLSPGDGLSLRDGRIVNPDGGISPIVHQHDRHPHLDRAIHDLWGQGLQPPERTRKKSVGERARKLVQSLKRRLPEPR